MTSLTSEPTKLPDCRLPRMKRSLPEVCAPLPSCIWPLFPIALEAPPCMPAPRLALPRAEPEPNMLEPDAPPDRAEALEFVARCWAAASEASEDNPRTAIPKAR